MIQKHFVLVKCQFLACTTMNIYDSRHYRTQFDVSMKFTGLPPINNNQCSFIWKNYCYKILQCERKGIFVYTLSLQKYI